MSTLATALLKYPVRVCRTLHHCEICQRDIRAGERYYDGGYARRAHTLCAENYAR